MRRKILLSLTLVGVLAAMLALSGCQSTDVPTQTGSQPTTKTITLYFSDDQAMNLVGETREITIKPSAQMASDEAGEIVKELIAGPKDPGLIATIPADTQLLGVEVAEGIATVDFSEELRSNHPGGSSGELMTLYSLVNSLTEVTGIKQVQIQIHGADLDTLAGHVDLTQPLTRDESRIKQ